MQRLATRHAAAGAIDHQQHGAGGGIAAGFLDHFQKAAVFSDNAFDTQAQHVVIGRNPAEPALAKQRAKRGDDANHGERTPKGDAPRQAAPFGDEIGFKRHEPVVARGARRGKGCIQKTPGRCHPGAFS